MHSRRCDALHGMLIITPGITVRIVCVPVHMYVRYVSVRAAVRIRCCFNKVSRCERLHKHNTQTPNTEHVHFHGAICIRRHLQYETRPNSLYTHTRKSLFVRAVQPHFARARITRLRTRKKNPLTRIETIRHETQNQPTAPEWNVVALIVKTKNNNNNKTYLIIILYDL